MEDRTNLSPSYILSEIGENYDDWQWWKHRIEQRINGPIQQRINPHSSGISILEEDWDTLVILDACRADLFEEVIYNFNIDYNESRSVVSNASATQEWLRRNFGSSHGDIVYIAGNPMVTRHRPSAFHKLIEVWRDAYSQETSIIDPKQITKRAIKARSDYPNKRLIIHYMQPHYPFIGYPSLNHATYDFEDVGLEGKKEGEYDGINSVWDALESGLVTREKVWEGYRNNLSTVMNEVITILKKIKDRVVVTSDHGNMLGGLNWPIPIRTYGHLPNLRNKNLVQVPYVVRKGERREILKEDTNSFSTATDTEIKERLSKLGYVD